MVLSCLVAAQAAGQALAYLDEGRVPGGLLEVSPGWRWRHRACEPHPDCGCVPGDATGAAAVPRAPAA